MKVQHDFSRSLARSHLQTNAPWWEIVYRKAFRGFESMSSVRCDGWAQRGGIDRIVVLTSGRTITIDEKVREKDWPDVLWEYWSDCERKCPGWCAKDLACEFIAYAYVPSRRCLLFPALMIRRAWIENGAEWVSRARRGEGGYRIVDARNDGYITRSVAVPLEETVRAVRDAMNVTW